jgi:membrane protein insertase Oxa1/YidC/SpoIIIJ
MYWITSNLMTLGQNYVIYNYGPGKKTSDSGKAERKGKGSQAKGSDDKETPQEDAAKQAAKIAKRKRRKKKK